MIMVFNRMGMLLVKEILTNTLILFLLKEFFINNLVSCNSPKKFLYRTIYIMIKCQVKKPILILPNLKNFKKNKMTHSLKNISNTLKTN